MEIFKRKETQASIKQAKEDPSLKIHRLNDLLTVGSHKIVDRYKKY